MRKLGVFLVVLGTSGAGTAETGQSVALRPKVNLISLFSVGDYPSDALAMRQSGTVTVKLTVNTTGRVIGCDVTESSGSSSLDFKTCEVFARRARFDPARGPAGRIITDTYVQRVRWSLPRSAADEGKAFWSARFDATGKPTECTMSLERTPRPRPCAEVMPTILAAWAMMHGGPTPAKVRVGFMEEMEPGDGKPLQPRPLNGGQTLAFDSGLHSVNADGSMGKCTFQTSIPTGAKRRCAPPPGMRKVPLDASGRPSVAALRIGRTLSVTSDW